MVRFPLLVSVLCAAALPLHAQSFACAGTSPDWTLDMAEGSAALALMIRTEMDLVHGTSAEGRDWPRAFTLIGERDTAIVLIERETCEDGPYRAHVFTQRGQTPILLTGCCRGGE